MHPPAPMSSPPVPSPAVVLRRGVLPLHPFTLALE